MFVCLWKQHVIDSPMSLAVGVFLYFSCMQRAKYDIGEEAISRFSLPPEDKATLELTEWVDAAFNKTSV